MMEGVDHTLSPFHCLILYALWAILVCVLPKASVESRFYLVNFIRERLFQAAQTGFVKGNFWDRWEEEKKEMSEFANL